jgi:hypothetical protein
MNNSSPSLYPVFYKWEFTIKRYQQLK